MVADIEGGTLDLEDEGTMTFRNVEKHSPNKIASHVRRPVLRTTLITVILFLFNLKI